MTIACANSGAINWSMWPTKRSARCSTKSASSAQRKDVGSSLPWRCSSCTTTADSSTATQRWTLRASEGRHCRGWSLHQTRRLCWIELRVRRACGTSYFRLIQLTVVHLWTYHAFYLLNLLSVHTPVRCLQRTGVNRQYSLTKPLYSLTKPLFKLKASHPAFSLPHRQFRMICLSWWNLRSRSIF